MTFCFQCGKEVPKENTFCPNCGTEAIRTAPQIPEITSKLTTFNSPHIDPKPHDGPIPPPSPLVIPTSPGPSPTILPREEMHKNRVASTTIGNFFSWFSYHKLLGLGFIVALILLLGFRIEILLFPVIIIGLIIYYQSTKITITKKTTTSTDEEPKWVSRGIRGTVRAMKTDKEYYPGLKQEKSRLLTFRLERTDPTGSIFEVIPIQAACKPESGADEIKNGDVVSIVGMRDKSGLFKALKIFNHSANLEFQSIKSGSPHIFLSNLFHIGLLLLCIAAFFGIFLGLLVIFAPPPYNIVGVAILVGCLGIIVIISRFFAIQMWGTDW